MELGRLKEAAVTFEELIAKKYDYPRAFYSLGETYGKLGRLDEAHYCLGIYYKEKNDFKNALFHLKRALDNISDPDKREKIKGNAERDPWKKGIVIEDFRACYDTVNYDQNERTAW